MSKHQWGEYDHNRVARCKRCGARLDLKAIRSCEELGYRCEEKCPKSSKKLKQLRAEMLELKTRIAQLESKYGLDIWD